MSFKRSSSWRRQRVGSYRRPIWWADDSWDDTESELTVESAFSSLSDSSSGSLPASPSSDAPTTGSEQSAFKPGTITMSKLDLMLAQYTAAVDGKILNAKLPGVGRNLSRIPTPIPRKGPAKKTVRFYGAPQQVAETPFYARIYADNISPMYSPNLKLRTIHEESEPDFIMLEIEDELEQWKGVEIEVEEEVEEPVTLMQQCREFLAKYLVCFDTSEYTDDGFRHSWSY